MISMDTTVLFVSASYVFHLVATIVWVGWSLLLVIVQRSPTSETAENSTSFDLNAFTRRGMPIAMLAFAALAATGLYQMASDSHYVDMLVLNTAWSRLLFLKHIVFVAEAVVLLAIRFVIEPDLDYHRRAGVQGYDDGRYAEIQRRYRWAAWINLALGLLILLITGPLTALP